MHTADEETLRQLVADALRRLRPVDPAEAKLAQKQMEITVNYKYQGYCNPLVVRDIATLAEGEIGYLKFTPLKNAGYVIMEAANKEDYGAVEYNRGESGNTATVNLHAALLEFPLRFPGNRSLRLPFSTLPMTDDKGQSKTVGLLRVKEPARKRSATRGHKPPNGPAPTQP